MRRTTTALMAILAVLSIIGVSAPAFAIVGGVGAPPGAFPSMVSVQRFDSGSSTWPHVCGGVIISPNLIMTAATCINPSFSYRIVAGSISRIPPFTTGYAIRALQTSTMVVCGDIGIVRLATPLTYSNSIQAAAILPQDHPNPVGDVVTLVGWGRVSATSPLAQYLQEASTVLISKVQAQSMLTSVLWSYRLATYDSAEQTSFCAGDKGGPVYLRNYFGPSGQQVVGGILSLGVSNCSPAYPGGSGDTAVCSTLIQLLDPNVAVWQ